MFQCLSVIRLRPPKLLSALRPSCSRRWALALAIVLGISIGEPVLNPSAAQACFFWQACARRRGRASNTRAGGKRTGRIVGGNNISIPYVISPRHTWIQDPDQIHYTIRWHPVAGANGYTVRLWRWSFERDRPDLALWETIVGNVDQLPFPEQVALEPGYYYSIEVVTDMGVSSNLDAGYYESGFQLLFEEDYQILRSQLAEIPLAIATNNDSTDSTTPEDMALAQAGVFFLEGMYADALAILQSLARRPSASDLVYTALGDTYSQTGLNQLAISAYKRALNLATANNDALSEANTRVNIADVYATVGLFENALPQLYQARNTYATLQEETDIARLDRRIDLIEAGLSRQEQTVPTP